MWHARAQVKWDGQNAVSFMPYNSSRSIRTDAKTFKILNQIQWLNPRGLNKDTGNFEYLDVDIAITEKEYSQPSCKWVKVALKASAWDYEAITPTVFFPPPPSSNKNPAEQKKFSLVWISEVKK